MINPLPWQIGTGYPERGTKSYGVLHVLTLFNGLTGGLNNVHVYSYIFPNIPFASVQ